MLGRDAHRSISRLGGALAWLDLPHAAVLRRCRAKRPTGNREMTRVEFLAQHEQLLIGVISVIVAAAGALAYALVAIRRRSPARPPRDEAHQR